MNEDVTQIPGSYDIIKQLKEERIRLGYTVYRLSKLSGVTQSTILRIERMEIYPKIDTVYALAAAMGKKIELV